MFDPAAAHSGFVIAAYGVSLAVLVILVAVTLLRARKARSEGGEE